LSDVNVQADEMSGDEEVSDYAAENDDDGDDDEDVNDVDDADADDDEDDAGSDVDTAGSVVSRFTTFHDTFQCTPYLLTSGSNRCY